MRRTAWVIADIAFCALVAGLLLFWHLRYAYAATTFSGAVSGQVIGVNTLAGNESGNSTFKAGFTHSLATGAAAPDIISGGGYQGTFTCPTTGGTLVLANSTNICSTGATGTIAPAQGYVITGAKKLRCLYLENTDAMNTVTVTIPASNGLAGLTWGASATIVVLQPGGSVVYTFPNGSSTLTTGTNDAIVCTSSAGTPTVRIAATFG